MLLLLGGGGCGGRETRSAKIAGQVIVRWAPPVFDHFIGFGFRMTSAGDGPRITNSTPTPVIYSALC